MAPDAAIIRRCNRGPVVQFPFRRFNEDIPDPDVSWNQTHGANDGFRPAPEGTSWDVAKTTAYEIAFSSVLAECADGRNLRDVRQDAWNHDPAEIVRENEAEFFLWGEQMRAALEGVQGLLAE